MIEFVQTTEQRRVFPVLVGLTRNEIAEAISDFPQTPNFRSEQLYKWMYSRGVFDPDQFTNMPKIFRNWLKERFQWNLINPLLKKQSDISGVKKFVFELTDERMVEGVWIPEKERATVCVSSQVGCALGCTFCATGTMGLIRNLSAGEIVLQPLLIRHQLKMNVTHIVFMGMGEPLHNYREVSKSVRILNDPAGLAIGKRHITVSTAGWVPGIYQMIDDKLPCRLAISMGSANESKRMDLMPVTKKYPLEELMKAANAWARSFDDYVTIEYTLIEGENDSILDTKRLVSLLHGIPAKVNVLTYNPGSHPLMKRPQLERVEEFTIELSKRFPGPVTRRLSRGDEIGAACGQLVIENLSKFKQLQS